MHGGGRTDGPHPQMRGRRRAVAAGLGASQVGPIGPQNAEFELLISLCGPHRACPHCRGSEPPMVMPAVRAAARLPMAAPLKGPIGRHQPPIPFFFISLLWPLPRATPPHRSTMLSRRALLLLAACLLAGTAAAKSGDATAYGGNCAQSIACAARLQQRPQTMLTAWPWADKPPHCPATGFPGLLGRRGAMQRRGIVLAAVSPTAPVSPPPARRPTHRRRPCTPSPPQARATRTRPARTPAASATSASGRATTLPCPPPTSATATAASGECWHNRLRLSHVPSCAIPAPSPAPRLPCL